MNHVPDEVHAWLKERAKKMGTPMTSVIMTAVDTYRNYIEAQKKLPSVNLLNELKKELDKLQKEIDKLKKKVGNGAET